MSLRALDAVSIDTLPDYPLDADMRLDSHSFIQWEFRRWMASDMRWNGTHECKSLWFELVNLAHSETPVGTLPRDLKRLSRMVQPAVTIDHFEALCALEFGPLHGWRPCRCDDDVRLMHPVVTRVVSAAFASKANHAARVAEASIKRRLTRLTEDIAQVAPQLAEDRRKVKFIDTMIQNAIEQRGGERRTPEEFHAALQACIQEERKGRFAKPVA